MPGSDGLQAAMASNHGSDAWQRWPPTMEAMPGSDGLQPNSDGLQPGSDAWQRWPPT